MNGPFFGEVLILILLIINCGRIFFLKFGKTDTLTVLAPVCIILSICQILAWGIDFFSFFMLVISIFAFFTNFRAIIRLFNGLFVDHYSIAFKIGAILILFLSITELGLLIYFRPILLNPKKYNIEQTKIRITGSFLSGIEKTSGFEKNSGIITKLQKHVQQNDETQNNVQTTQIEQPQTAFQKKQVAPVIFITDKRADTYNYLPFLYELSKMGFTVYCTDFYTNDIRWAPGTFNSKYFRRIYTLYSYFKNTIMFENEKEFYTYNSMKEINALVKFLNNERLLNSAQNDKTLVQDAEILSQIEELKPFLIGDWMANDALIDFEKQHKDEISGILQLTSFEQYKTKGFGFIEQTNPLTAYFLKLKPNRNTTEINLLAKKVAEHIPHKIIQEYLPTENETASNIINEPNQSINEKEQKN